MIDLEKTFDVDSRSEIWKILKKGEVDDKILELIKHVYIHTRNTVRIEENTAKFFQTDKGVQKNTVVSFTQKLHQ